MDPIASVSVDLDNKWSYLKTRGYPAWREFPSFLDIVVPRILELASDHGITITVFVVGQDAELPDNRLAMAALGDSSHEIGNHSFYHEPWMHLKTESEVRSEVSRSDIAIKSVLRRSPRGFRGPGYSISPATLRTLQQAGYEYDASILPTFIGPLARRFYKLGADRSSKEESRQQRLFGRFRDGFLPNGPFVWNLGLKETIYEIPISTMPVFRLPIHATYLLQMAVFSEGVARAYLRSAMNLLRRFSLQASFLLHGIDFVGGDEVDGLGFFPTMTLRGSTKRRLISSYLEMLADHFELVPIEEQLATVRHELLSIHDATALT